MSDDQRQEDDRTSYLATGFAAGGLDDQEKDEFYALLRRPGEAGTRTARVAWSSLHIAADLRGSLGTLFQDTVTHRLKNPGETGPGGQFVPDVFTRLGITRPRLEDVTVPVSVPTSAPRRKRWPMILVSVLVIALLSWSSLHFLSTPGGRLAWSTGTVTRSGAVISPGATFDVEPIAVSAGGLAEILLGNGGRVRIRGPANVVVQPAGVAVVSGEAWVTATTTALVVGLPDGRLKLSPGSQVSIAATANRATVATISGTVVLTSGNAATGVPLAAGRATAGGDHTFPWHPFALANCHVEKDVRRLVDAEPSCATWILTANFVPRGLDHLATIQAGARVVRLGAGWLQIDEGIRQQLSGVPLVQRTVRLERGIDGVVLLQVEGLTPATQTLKWDSVPQTLSGEALTAVHWGSGPAAEPAQP